MKINKERLISDLLVLREISDTPGEGVTRFSYGEKDRIAREYILRAASDAGFGFYTDAVGNMYIGSNEENLDSALDPLNAGIKVKKRLSLALILIRFRTEDGWTGPMECWLPWKL